MCGMDVLGVIRRIFFVVFDTILPPRERTARTQARTIADIPLTPAAHDLLNADVTTIMDYRASAVQDLIHALKYDGSGAAASLAASVLADYLREEIAEAKQFSPREILLVPVPLHKSRKRDRGFNQIEIVLNALPREFRDGTLSRLAPELLVRTKATRQQTKLPRAERIKNMSGAFAVTDSGRAAHSHAFVIDDVATTGATLKHAGKPLEKSGARITLLALARA